MYEYKKKFLPLIFFLLVFIDQLSKYIVRLRQPADSGFYICNPGVAFGIKIPDILFWSFWLIIIFMLTVFLYKKCFIPNTLYLILILSGALSNMLDRFAYGCVIDFIDLKILPRSELVWGWPLFNLADTFIVLGVIVVLLNQFKHLSIRKLFKN